jgi:uncharacterized protein YndB with AHSA1/START domain
MMNTLEIENPRINDVIISSRVFNTDLKTMIRAWTEPDQLSKWWGPNGFTNTFHIFDLRPGGDWKFTMHGPNGQDYLNECTFLKIETGQIIWRHHSKPTFHINANFEEFAGRTRVIFVMIFDSPQERDTLRSFVAEKNEENFDRLEVVLGAMKQN